MNEQMNKPGFIHEYLGSRLSTQGIEKPFPILDQSCYAHRALHYGVNPVLAKRSLRPIDCSLFFQMIHSSSLIQTQFYLTQAISPPTLLLNRIMRSHCSDSETVPFVTCFEWTDFVWLQENELTHLNLI